MCTIYIYSAFKEVPQFRLATLVASFFLLMSGLWSRTGYTELVNELGAPPCMGHYTGNSLDLQKKYGGTAHGMSQKPRPGARIMGQQPRDQ